MPSLPVRAGEGTIMDCEPPAPTVQEIIEAVAAHAGCSHADLTGPSRLAALVRARHLAIWLAHQIGRQELSLPALGRCFNRDHTTMIYALRQHEERSGQRDPTEVWLEVITHG